MDDVKPYNLMTAKELAEAKRLELELDKAREQAVMDRSPKIEGHARTLIELNWTKAEVERLRAALDGAQHELGVYGPDDPVPAPIAKALEWIDDALTPQQEPCKHDGMILDTYPPKCGKCGARGSRSSNKVFTPDT